MTEETHTEIKYPILFPLKVMGKDEPDFEDFVIERVGCGTSRTNFVNYCW